MKITIDTKEDSHEDMKHVLEMLTNLLQKGAVVNTAGMMSMFDSEPVKEEPAMPMSMFNTPVKESGDAQLFGMSQRQQGIQQNETPPDFSAFLNLTKENQEDDENHEPQVEYF
ncbi:hypothetical protein HQ489_02040 [Candidatus Woesearchaeota archaeon]|nr:hypothetical protein [Candidatus Woesearchaeota archaeon]